MFNLFSRANTSKFYDRVFVSTYITTTWQGAFEKDSRSLSLSLAHRDEVAALVLMVVTVALIDVTGQG